MTIKIFMVILASSSLLVTSQASAQWLDPTLDAQRWSNLRKHQQQQAKKAASQKKQTRSVETAPPLTRAQRKAAWSIHETEYKRRVTRDGYVSADRWFEDRARAIKTRP